MQLVDRKEIMPISEYEMVREHFRARVIAEKKGRRVTLGDRMSAVFENHDTVLLQIQEMLRTERITKEKAILHELETYNQLVPGANELSLTAMIEIDDKLTREKFLTDARGIEKCFSLDVVLGETSETCKATWDETRAEPDRASAVLYLKIPLTPAAASAMRTGKARAELVVDHPAYSVRAPLPAGTVVNLAEDLISE